MSSFCLHKYVATTIFIVTLGFSVKAFADTELRVADHFSEYQNFLRHKGTHFFAEDGLQWDQYDLILSQGTKNADGACVYDSSSIPNSANTGGRQYVSVEQAVNRSTCESLIRRGWLLPGSKIPSSDNSIINGDKGVALRHWGSSSTQSATLESQQIGVGYKIAARIESRFDDGNNPIQTTTGNLFTLPIGSASATLLYYPHYNPNGGTDPDCLADNGDMGSYGGTFTNDGSSRGWTSDTMGCGTIQDYAGYPWYLVANVNGNAVSTAPPYPAGEVGDFCRSLAGRTNACSARIPTMARLGSATSGTMNNKTSICLLGFCAFDCSKDGGLTIRVNRLAVTYSRAEGFIPTRTISVNGPVEKCSENLRRVDTYTADDNASCSDQDGSSCRYYY